MSRKRIRLGDAIFTDIEENRYLNQLYEDILFNYANKTLRTGMKYRNVNIHNALRFADLLSKSNNPDKAERHKMWSQELVVLLNALYPDNDEIKTVAGSVFANTDNARGISLLDTDFEDPFVLNRIYSVYKKDYLRIPAAPGLQFFGIQKQAYDHLKDPFFSYSAPTSMGKSFLMRMFIKEQVANGKKLNFAIIVPTKALINETSQKIIKEDLKGLLEEKNYKVVNAASDIALEGKHNFILVLTPERLLYLLIGKPELQIDYLFVDEAHKMSGKNSRGPFYYKTVDMLKNRDNPPHFIFASPNVPNPEVYLRLLTDISEHKDKKLRTTFSPVTQVKFLLDLQNHEISVYNEHTETKTYIASIPKNQATLTHMLLMLERRNDDLPEDAMRQTIVYFNGKTRAVEAALDLSQYLEELDDEDLAALSRDIANEVHGDYYLAKIIKKGIAYHIGYLPAAIRMRIEDMFRKGKITTMFCTSTLLEGVNLPADNLFITDNKIFRTEMNPVDFRNLIGRVGRIEYNLYGNVIFVSSQDGKLPETEYEKMLKEKVPEQTLSIDAGPKTLTNPERKYIAEALKEGNVELVKRKQSQSEESYIMMRKFGLILLRDIMTDNHSLVRQSFSDLITSSDAEKIKAKFSNNIALQDDDINISSDQTKNLIIAIRNGLEYPKMVDGKFIYKDVVAFLEELCEIFKWEKYEYSTLGKVTDGVHKKLRWYAVILIQWMSGFGLSNIMKKGIQHHINHPDNFWISKTQTTIYKDNVEFRNILFADTLEVIDNIILFSLSNYFLRFSNEYKKIHNVTEFENNWYEYVEYGTTNPATILLQRIGFTRENSTYIRSNKDKYILHEGDSKLLLSRDLLECENQNVREQAKIILLNMPEMFETNGNR
jgi:superfamily II DNA or RNA helicase